MTIDDAMLTKIAFTSGAHNSFHSQHNSNAIVLAKFPILEKSGGSWYPYLCGLDKQNACVPFHVKSDVSVTWMHIPAL